MSPLASPVCSQFCIPFCLCIVRVLLFCTLHLTLLVPYLVCLMVIKFCHPLCTIVLYQLPCISLFVCILSLYLVISPTVSFVSCICFVLLCLLVKSVVSPSECPNLSLCAVTSCFICSLCSLVFCIEFCFLCLVNYYWVHLCSHVPPLPLVTCLCIYLLSPFISCQINILLFFSVAVLLVFLPSLVFVDAS